MEIWIYDDKRIVEVWLTSAEKADIGVQAQLKPMYVEYKKKGYLTAVFLSGDQDLYQQTTDLLKYNRTRSAQREVQQETVNRAVILT